MTKYYDQTFFHPLVLGLTLLAGIYMLMSSRRSVIPLILAVAVFAPLQQRVVVFGFDFMMHRILILFALVHILSLPEKRNVQWITMDKILVAFVVVGCLTYILLRRDFHAVVNRMGHAYDVLGLYFVFRLFIQDRDDYVLIVRVLFVLCVILSLAMLVEHSTGRNLFSILGGVSEFTMERKGRLRCQGAFAHPILAGTFGASLVPLFVAVYRYQQPRLVIAIIGLLAAAVVTYTAASSGPIITLLAGIVGMSMWMVRRYLREIRFATFTTLVILHFAMAAPIWALMWRAAIVPGSTGYHRYRLFNAFMINIRDWWMLGIEGTAQWGYFLFDITNEYVAIGVTGGLFPLLLFVWVLVAGYQAIGRALRALEHDETGQRLAWALGATLFAHTVTFMGVSYFDQMKIVWYLMLAMVASAPAALAACEERLPGTSGEPDPATLHPPFAAGPSVGAPS